MPSSWTSGQNCFSACSGKQHLNATVTERNWNFFFIIFSNHNHLWQPLTLHLAQLCMFIFTLSLSIAIKLLLYVVAKREHFNMQLSEHRSWQAAPKAGTILETIYNKFCYIIDKISSCFFAPLILCTYDLGHICLRSILLLRGGR